MKLFFPTLVLSVIGLIVLNVSFVLINLIFWGLNGVDHVIKGDNFVEVIYYSEYLKWILIGDIIWVIGLFAFLISRRHYKTDLELHYLTTKKIEEPKVCVIIPTFNEEQVIKEVLTSYSNQQNIEKIIVIDNNSTDKTVEIAKSFGVNIIEKTKNKGLADSVIQGLIQFLETSSNIVVITECDGTFSAEDLSKMIPYLDNCDMVVGTRQIQVLTEKGNQNSMFYVWGNYLLAKLIQIKYFSLTNMGIVELTDVGCLYRCIRRDALEKIKKELSGLDAERIMRNPNSGLIANFLTMISIENNLRIVEVPITFKNRIGTSKTGANKKNKAIVYGLRFFWYIITK